jgi:hypothetical protein
MPSYRFFEERKLAAGLMASRNDFKGLAFVLPLATVSEVA